jgi:lipopolysaccharide/colanic/teichoic acid biosynthesis glycosyltransferase
MVFKRIFDIFFSLIGIILTTPILFLTTILVWISDFHFPLYISNRVGRSGKEFKMVKIRTMIKNADKSGVDSTSKNDSRITKVGHYIRNLKLDEITQLLNVFFGQMSLVGPRPNVKRETDLYSIEEKKLLSVKPGITDFSSIIFSDLGDILKNSEDPNITYNQLIRPWKSRFGILYIKNRSLLMDIKLIILTIVSLISKEFSLKMIIKILKKITQNSELIEVAKRKNKLKPMPPPGFNNIITTRKITFKNVKS